MSPADLGSLPPPQVHIVKQGGISSLMRTMMMMMMMMTTIG
jgi:hypothetical protein